MSNYRFIVLDIQPDYPLESIKTHVYYRATIDKQEGRYIDFFVLNGNIYCEVIVCKVYKNACDRTVDRYCCSIEKLKRFIAKTNISQFFKFKKKTELETVNDLYIMVMECGYKREIDRNELYEAEDELKSDFSSRYKFNDFKFTISTGLNPSSYPGDALITHSKNGALITLDMISGKRKQPVPDCIKDEISYWANKMLEENLINIKDVHFLLHAEIKFSVIGTLYKDYKVYIIMINSEREQLHEEHFCLCDCKKELENAMEEYFENELFRDKAFNNKEESANGNG